MSDVKLNALTREPGKANVDRNENYVPVVLYGPGADNQSLKIKKGELQKAYNKAGESTLIDLSIDEKKSTKVLIKDTQKDPTKGDFIHMDLYQVKMDEEITTEIPLEFIGESRAVKEQGGFLVKNLYSLEVECLPGDLVHSIEIDVTPLETFEDDIRVKDVNLPKGMKYTGDEEEMIVSVTPPEEEAEEEEEMTEEDVAAGEAGKEESSEEGEEGDQDKGEQEN